MDMIYNVFKGEKTGFAMPTPEREGADRDSEREVAAILRAPAAVDL